METFTFPLRVLPITGIPSELCTKMPLLLFDAVLPFTTTLLGKESSMMIPWSLLWQLFFSSFTFASAAIPPM